jgi:hypothetical protein
MEKNRPTPQQTQRLQQQSKQSAPIPTNAKKKQPKRTPQKSAKPSKPKGKGPEIYGYRPPKWAKDYEFVRKNKGKGAPGSSKTWLLTNIDRLLKKHSI